MPELEPSHCVKFARGACERVMKKRPPKIPQYTHGQRSQSAKDCDHELRSTWVKVSRSRGTRATRAAHLRGRDLQLAAVLAATEF